MQSIEDIFMAHWHSQQGVAPNPLLMPHLNQIRSALKFIDDNPQANKLKDKIKTLMQDSNWLLETVKLESFIQIVGEAQFWELARNCDVNLESIVEQGKHQKKTPDFRLADTGDGAPCFEIKTLSVVSSQLNLKNMDESSFETQLDLAKQVAAGKKIAISINEISPHGEVKANKTFTTLIRNLINKANNNIKSGQYSDAPTCLVLNLLLIDGYYTGNAHLRPVVGGYPSDWNLMSGVYWALAFGKSEHLVYGLPEFEGLPSVEGSLEREGILISHPEIAALILVIHGLSSGTLLYGLKRHAETELWEGNEHKILSYTFSKLVGDNWNDDVDSNGYQLTEY